MSKQSLLLVDGDARSLRVLEVSLRKAGFTITTAINGADALDKLALSTPDLVIAETKLDQIDGFELCRRLKGNPTWADIPFVFLTADTGIEPKVKGLELGVDDYLTKPIYIKEVVTRLQILLQKRQRTRIEERRDDARTRFVGRLTDMAVVDLIQTIEISRKSGVIQFTGEHGRQAAIYFRDGKVIDAEAGPLQGEDAVYRLLTWNDGSFEVVFRTVRRRDAIATSSQGLLMEGMRRLDEWTRLLEQLPALDTRFEVDTLELGQRLGDIPDENNNILKLIDGRRTLTEVIDACAFGDLECLQAVSRLYFEGLLIEIAADRFVEVEARVLDPIKTESSDTWVVPPSVFEETPTHVTPPRTVTPSGAPLAPIARIRTTRPPSTPPAPRAPTHSAPLPVVAVPPLRVAAMDPSAGATPVAEPSVAPPQPPEPEPSIPSLMASSSPSGSIRVTPLAGQFRPSGLRLIDEAVAAAQAIAPELVDDFVAPAGTPPLSTDAAIDGLFDGAVPTVIPIDEPEISAASAASAAARVIAADGIARFPRSEGSAPRVLASHGADKAQVSGEVSIPRDAIEEANSTQRELVTIKPRRITREMLAVVPPEDAVIIDGSVNEPSDPGIPSLPARAPGLSSGNGARPSSELAIPVAAIAAIPHPAEPDPRASERARVPSRPPMTGTGTSRSMQSIGLLPWLLAIAGVALVAVGVARCRRGALEPLRTVVAVDAATRTPIAAGRPDATMTVRPIITADAEPSVAPPDAAAIVRVKPDAAPKPTHSELRDAAREALSDNDPELALDYANKSLAIRRTARTYILKADALRRLGKVDDALVAIDAGIDMDEAYPRSWEMKGRILWGARRLDEARIAYELYLKLEPTGETATRVRALLGTQQPKPPPSPPSPSPDAPAP